MTSFKRPIESSQPRRKTPPPAQPDSRRSRAKEWGDMAAMSEAGSRRDMGALPVAYAVPAPASEMEGFPRPSAPDGSYAR